MNIWTMGKMKSKWRATAPIAVDPPAQKLWIVVDDVVYHCPSFIREHPGGLQVILSFVGENCSLQFWRFHSKGHMEEVGRPLRIGRTKNVKKRFKEPRLYVGSKRLGSDYWDRGDIIQIK